MYLIVLYHAGEISSSAMERFTMINGIVMEYSPAHAKDSNGSFQKLIQELWKVRRAIICDSRLPNYLWSDVISHANWLRNRLRLSATN